MPTESLDSEVFICDEASSVPAHYKPYLQAKRIAFVTNLREQRLLWDFYAAIDEAWTRGLEGCESGGGVYRQIPMLLYLNAHAKVRVAIDLAFSGCLAEARSILRDGIEFIAHAHMLHTQPALQTLWYRKEEQLTQWDHHFTHAKKTRLFAGLELLYDRWAHYSTRGSHANLSAIIGRISMANIDGVHTSTLSYCGGEQGGVLTISIQELLMTCMLMADVFLEDFKPRLQFDETLTQMRERIQQHRRKVNDWIYANIPDDLNKQIT